MSSQSHIVRSFDNDLRALSQKIDLMAQNVKSDFSRASNALINHDQQIASEIVARKGYMFRLQMELEEQALSILALRQPMASDLRDTFFTVKIAAYLNAISNDILGVCQRVSRLKKPLSLDLLEHIQELCKVTNDMVDPLPNLLSERTSALAKTMHEQDDLVDECYGRIYKTIRKYMKNAQTETTPQDLHVVFIAKYIERAGDNIAAISAIVYQQTTGELLNKKLLD